MMTKISEGDILIYDGITTGAIIKGKEYKVFLSATEQGRDYFSVLDEFYYSRAVADIDGNLVVPEYWKIKGKK